MNGSKKIRRILHVYPRLQNGGLERVIANIASALPRPDYAHDILTVEPGDPAVETLLKERGCRIFRLEDADDYATDRSAYFSKHPRRYRRKIEEFIKSRILFNEPYDAIHAHHHRAMEMATLAAKRCGIKLRILHSHMAHPDITGWRRFISGIAYLRHSRGTNTLIGCSEMALRWVFPFNSDCREVVMVNGVDTEIYHYDPSKRESARDSFLKELNLPSDTPICINIGRCTQQKNQRFILELARQFNKQEFRSDDNSIVSPLFLIIGDGPLLDILRAEAEESDIKNIVFTGATSDAAKWLNMADLMLLPSLFEGQPLTLVEAQATGLPVIASPAVTSESDAGLGLLNILPLSDSAEWHNTIINQLSTSSDIRSECRRIASERFSTLPAYREFTLEGISATLSGIYNNQSLQSDYIAERRALVSLNPVKPSGLTGGDQYDKKMLKAASDTYRIESHAVYPDKIWKSFSPVDKLRLPFEMLREGKKIQRNLSLRGYETKWLFNTARCLYSSTLAHSLELMDLKTITITHHPLYIQFSGWRQKLYRHIELKMLAAASLRLAASEFTRRELLKANPRLNIETLDIPFDIPVEADGTPTKLLNNSGEKRETFSIIFIGSIERRKRLHILLDAIKKLEENGFGVSLDIIGFVADEEYHTSLLTMAGSLKSNVKFHGFVAGEVKDDMLRQSDVLVLPSSAEGFGMVLIEAMAAGLPVVATRSSGMIDVVGEQEQRGLLAEPDDAFSLAECISRLMEDSDLYRRLAEAGRNFAVSRSDSRQFRTTLLTLLNQ